MEDVKIDVLGTEYAIHYRNEHDDPLLDGKCRDGYTDNSAHEIVICNQKRIVNCKTMRITGKVYLDTKLFMHFYMKVA